MNNFKNILAGLVLAFAFAGVQFDVVSAGQEPSDKTEETTLAMPKAAEQEEKVPFYKKIWFKVGAPIVGIAAVWTAFRLYNKKSVIPFMSSSSSDSGGPGSVGGSGGGDKGPKKTVLIMPIEMGTDDEPARFFAHKIGWKGRGCKYQGTGFWMSESVGKGHDFESPEDLVLKEILHGAKPEHLKMKKGDKVFEMLKKVEEKDGVEVYALLILSKKVAEKAKSQKDVYFTPLKVKNFKEGDKHGEIVPFYEAEIYGAIESKDFEGHPKFKNGLTFNSKQAEIFKRLAVAGEFKKKARGQDGYDAAAPGLEVPYDA